MRNGEIFFMDVFERGVELKASLALFSKKKF